MVAFKTYEVRRKDKPVDASNLDNKGGDLLTHFHATMHMVRNAHPDLLVTSQSERFAAIETITAVGRYVELAVDAGTYGLGGRVRAVSDGTVEHTFDNDRVSTSISRMIFAVPTGGSGGILFIERISGRSSASAAVVDLFKMSLKRKYAEDKITFNSETIVESNAWLEAAELTKVTGRVFGWSPDAVEKGRARPVGDLVSAFVPPDRGRFGRYILKGLRNHTIRPSALLGLQQEPDEVAVELEANGRSKTFLLGRERTPTISLLLTDHGQPRPDDQEFRRQVFELAREHMENVAGQPWTAAQERGDWSQEQLEIEVDVAPPKEQ